MDRGSHSRERRALPSRFCSIRHWKKGFTTPDNRLLQVNQAFADLLGYTFDELEHINFTEITDPLDRAQSEECHQDLLINEQSQCTLELRYLRKNGSVIWVDVRVTLLRDDAGSPLYFISSVADISKRKHAETELARYRDSLEQLVEARTAELNHAKQRLEVICTTAPTALLASSETKIDQSNAMFNRLFLTEPDAYFGQSLSSLAAAEDRPRLAALIETIRVDRQGQQGEYLAVRADKTTFEARIGIGYIHARDALDGGLVCSVQDISEQKQRERQLRYHASLQDNVTEAVIATDLNFRIQSWNPAAERIYGWRADEVLGQHVTDVLQTEFASGKTWKQVLYDFIKKGFWSDEVIQQHRDGHPVHLLSSTVLFKDQDDIPLGWWLSTTILRNAKWQSAS